MPKLKVMTIVGTRPEIIRLSRLIPKLDIHCEHVLVHTGQNYDYGLNEVFFNELGIRKPDVFLEAAAATAAETIGQVIIAADKAMAAHAPEALLLLGDTNSSLAAIAAKRRKIPIFHMEAGNRCFDFRVPEEINRLVTDAIADLLLVSEPAGEVNLRHEGVAESRIRFVGNVMIDTLVRELREAQALRYAATLGLKPQGYAVVTLHRPSNVDDAAQLEALMAFLLQVSASLHVVFPVHPRTRARLEQAGWLDRLTNDPAFRILPPVSYRENLSLLADARLVLTDSGGIQEETSSLGVPCLTLRKNTERPVTVSEGTNTLVGGDLALATQLVGEILAGTYKQGAPIRGWDGRASERVLDALEEMLGPA